MRMRKKKNLVPRMEACGGCLVRDPFAMRGQWRTLMPEARELRVVAMERVTEAGLKNVFFVDGDAALLPDMFASGEVDRLYINFCDPWPKSNQKKRRLTHGNFLKQYRKVLSEGGQLHFKTDNDKLFAWSVEEIPQFGFQLSEVTTDLHKDGPVGVMTDYERKFFSEGKNINRCVATMVPWEEPEAPADDAEAE